MGGHWVRGVWGKGCQAPRGRSRYPEDDRHLAVPRNEIKFNDGNEQLLCTILRTTRAQLEDMVGNLGGY